MIKIAQITDLHLLTKQDEKIRDVNTWDTYNEVMALVKSRNYDAVIATGDIADNGQIEAYGNFMLGLKDLTCPLYYVMGNHDNLEHLLSLTEVLPLLQQDKCILLGSWCFILLNSALLYHNEGVLSSAELAFLQDCLQKNTGKHVAIFLHHHPVAINSEYMDKCMLDKPEEFLAIIKSYANVKLVCFGHIHQDFTAEVDHIKFLGSPSTCFQAKKQTCEFDQDPAVGPGYRELTFNDDGSFDTALHYVS